MFSLTRHVARAACGSPALQQMTVIRSFAAKMSPDDPALLQSLKEQHLKGESDTHIPGTEGWSHALASSSEAVVKADKAPEVSIEELQNHSVEVIKQVHHDEQPQKKGLDVSHHPSIKENIKHTQNQRH